MQTRSDLNALAVQLSTVSSTWDGGEKIFFNGIESVITKVVKDILDKMDAYLDEEKSLKCRFDTLQNIGNGVNELISRPEIKSGARAQLQATFQKVKKFIAQTLQRQKYTEDEIDQKVSVPIRKLLLDFPSRLEERIRGAAFRTMKEVPSDVASFVTGEIHGSFQFVSFQTLAEDLNTFINAHRDKLSLKQIFQMQQAASLLTDAGFADIELSLWGVVDRHDGISRPALKNKLADIVCQFEKKIDQLQAGQSILVPGGFVHKKSGHAVLYEIQRVSDSEYHFSIFNTGSGAEFGQHSFDALKMNLGIAAQSYVPVFVNLPKEAISDQKFLMELLSPQVAHITGISMDSIHEIIQKQFTEKFSGKQTVREPHDLQSWGTCAYDSVLAFLEYKLPPSLFVPFHYELMLRARSSLNSILPEGQKEKVFSSEILKYIDNQSCKTIAAYREKFYNKCGYFPDFDTYLSYFVIREQRKVGGHMCLFSRTDPATEQDLKDTIKFFSDSAFETGNWAEIDRMKKIEEVIEKICPEQMNILRTRNQALVPNKLFPNPNKAVLHDLDLERLLNYLKSKYEECAVCDFPELFSYPTHLGSLVREATRNCKEFEKFEKS